MYHRYHLDLALFHFVLELWVCVLEAVMQVGGSRVLWEY